MPSPPAEDPHTDLLCRCALGDQRAFEQLYRATSAKLFGIVLRVVRRQDWAEEILQESFVNIWHHAPSYASGKTAPMTWMTHIVRNLALDWLPRPQRADAASEDAKETMKSGMSKSDHGDIAVLNPALTLEYQAITAYQVGAESNLLQKPVLAVAVKYQRHHRAHTDILSATVKKPGGTPVGTLAANGYGFPVEKLKNQANVLRFAAGLEHGAALAYLGGVPAFHNRALAKTAAGILGDETMHWSALLNAMGEYPVPAAFMAKHHCFTTVFLVHLPPFAASGFGNRFQAETHVTRGVWRIGRLIEAGSAFSPYLTSAGAGYVSLRIA